MKQTPGQTSLFSIIWKHFPGCTRGYCSLCGHEVAYSSMGTGGPNMWIDESQRCIKCGAVFSKDDESIPRDLPLVSGLNGQPIVLTIDCEAYTQEDIDKHGGIEWLKHKRCVEWFSRTDTASIDAYIAEQERLCRR